MRDVTQILKAAEKGDAKAAGQLLPLVYAELRRLASHRMAQEAPGHTLQPTALINEAYLRLVGVQAPLQGRKHFFALAARLMRQILVDRARRHSASKRGGGFQVETLNEESHGVKTGIEEFLILDQALTRLAASEPRLAQVVELHYFGGLNGPEISELLGIPVWSVTRDHRLAEAWLRRELSAG